MSKVRVSCDQCAEQITVSGRSPEVELGRAGWHRVGSRTLCPLCSSLAGVGAPEKAIHAPPALPPAARRVETQTPQRSVARAAQKITERTRTIGTGTLTELYLPLSRQRAAAVLVPAALLLALFAGWLLSLTIRDGNPQLTGWLWLVGSVAVAVYVARLAFRSLLCRVDVDESGLVVHNLRSTIRLAWSEVAAIDVATDTYGLPEWVVQAPPFAARVQSADGSDHVIAAARYSGSPATSAARREVVAAYVERLRTLAPDGALQSPAPAGIRPARVLPRVALLVVGLVALGGVIARLALQNSAHVFAPFGLIAVALVVGGGNFLRERL